MRIQSRFQLLVERLNNDGNGEGNSGVTWRMNVIELIALGSYPTSQFERKIEFCCWFGIFYRNQLH